MNTARRRTAVAKRALDVVSDLHHLDDAGLRALARAVWDELRERETTAARVDAGATMTDDRMGNEER